MSNHLHIVAFDNPYPPRYGGVIDIWYKISVLHDAGMMIHLHYFSYGKKKEEEDILRQYCATVQAYPRKTGWRSQLSIIPYIVYSRKSEALIQDLCRDDYPILFEGLHTCYYLDDPRLKGRRLLYRESNIEHDYYRHLAKAERNPLKKVFFLCESRKLRHYEQVLENSSVMLTVSQADTEYLQRRFPSKKVIRIPSFHKDDEVISVPGKGDFVLYQGNLSVAENTAAVSFLIRKVWNESMPPLVIAGKNPSKSLVRLAKTCHRIRLIANPDDATMTGLLRDAHINLMVTFQPTGLKLKLLNALFNGRFCLVNEAMLAGTGLTSLCSVAATPEQFREEIRRLFTCTFTEEETGKRRDILSKIYSNRENGKLLLQCISS
ncbi:MAG TPA: glycosyltransferase family 1 protein [Bacteroidales bacterium]|nr:glycosyltransferase family 1 protein [Bacteroidales bacterium]HPS73622.1 glycosyltransferase family 1 protein [Bacteroidales bacterium]